MSINYDALQEGIRSAVVNGTGLPDADVVWAYNAYQGGPRPAGRRFVTLLLGPSTSLGIDSYDTDYDATRAAGSEIRLRTSTIQQFGVMAQCFGGTPIGSTSAAATLERFRNRLALPSVRNELHAVGCSPFDSGSVSHVPFIEGTKFESRAVLEFRCYIEASEAEFTTFIARVMGSYDFYEAGTFPVLEGTFDVRTGE